MDGQHEHNTPRQQDGSPRTPVRRINTTPAHSGRYRQDSDSDENRGPPNAALTAHGTQTSATAEDSETHRVQDHWDLVGNDTPPYIRAQQAQARRDAELAARANAVAAVHEDPFVLVGRNTPTDIVDGAGNRVRRYSHTPERQVVFTPGTPTPRPRAPRSPMAQRLDFAGDRPPTPFPGLGPRVLDLNRMPRQQDIEFQQRAADQYRDYQEVRDRESRVTPNIWNGVPAMRPFQPVPLRFNDPQQHGSVQNAPVGGRPNGGIRIRTGPLPRHPDGRFMHRPLGWRPTEIDERQMFIDEYGVVPWEDQTPYISAAHDRRRGINNPLRPTRPTWEQESDSDDEPRRARPYALRAVEYPEEEYGDDEASVKQNRPEDYPQRPRGRRMLRVMNPDPEEATTNVHGAPAKPFITRAADVNQAPLYGSTVFDNRRGCQSYIPTPRLHDWLHNSSNAREARDDFFLDWLHAEQAGSPDEPAPLNQPNLGSPTAEPAPAEPDADPTGNSSPVVQQEGTRSGKRGADGPADERPSKRSRLASTFRRKLSLSGTVMGTTNGSGDTSLSSSKRRASGFFNVQSFSSMRGGLSRASSVGPKRVRIAVIGDSSAGKTTLLNRLYTGMYQPAEKSTHHRNNDFGMVVDGHQIILEAWDVPGDLPGDETHPLNRSFFDSALICFSVDNVQNVNKAPRWVNLLQSCLVVDIPLYLVGLKSDARPSFPKLRLPFMNEATPSSREQCENVARNIGAVEYFECSAKTGEGVDDMFNTVIQHARSKKDEEELKRASRLRKEKLKRGLQHTGRRISNLFRGKLV